MNDHMAIESTFIRTGELQGSGEHSDCFFFWGVASIYSFYIINICMLMSDSTNSQIFVI